MIPRPGSYFGLSGKGIKLNGGNWTQRTLNIPGNVPNATTTPNVQTTHKARGKTRLEQDLLDLARVRNYRGIKVIRQFMHQHIQMVFTFFNLPM